VHGALGSVLVLFADRSKDRPVVLEKGWVLVDTASVNQSITLLKSVLHNRAQLR
jgi:hypothetical protein